MLQSLLAGAFTVAILVVATASSVATTVALRGWAHSSYEASLHAPAWPAACGRNGDAWCDRTGIRDRP
ncbi:MAG: hypothetical protein LCH95_07715 [Proteobacteria bacterium]|nr:hypothetical protein [Pseudomonadota bacterium]